MKITAAVSRSPDAPFTLESVDLDEPRPDEVLVRLHAKGVCHTDLTFKSRVPGSAVLGHEGAGVVEPVGAEVTGVTPGDHVLLSYRSCGECAQCRAGHRPYCSRGALLNSSGGRADGTATLSQNGTRLFGSFFGQSSFAQYALAAVDNAVVVDDSVDLTLVAPLGCGFQTGAGAVLKMLNPEPNSRLVVYGARRCRPGSRDGGQSCRRRDCRGSRSGGLAPSESRRTRRESDRGSDDRRRDDGGPPRHACPRHNGASRCRRYRTANAQIAGNVGCG